MKHRPEYRELEKTEGALWRNKYPKELLPNFTIVQSLQIIRELEEIWVLFARREEVQRAAQVSYAQDFESALEPHLPPTRRGF
jgi:hypothetical protein